MTGDTSSLEDIFVRDLVNQTTTRVTVDNEGGTPDAAIGELEDQCRWPSRRVRLRRD